MSPLRPAAGGESCNAGFFLIWHIEMTSMAHPMIVRQFLFRILKILLSCFKCFGLQKYIFSSVFYFYNSSSLFSFYLSYFYLLYISIVQYSFYTLFCIVVYYKLCYNHPHHVAGDKHANDTEYEHYSRIGITFTQTATK